MRVNGMINKNIEEITKDDLQALIDSEVTERKTIEYKQRLPGNSDKEKKEFLADISSFANSSGGDIIYGVIEDTQTGKPKSLTGLEIQNIDQEKLRLENMIRAGIQPRIPSVTISPSIPIENSNSVLIIRIAKSWISPHRVIYGSHDKFYSRSSNGKYPLDVGELRIAFNLSETIIERIRNFRLDRISVIIANETLISKYYSTKIILHLIPIASFNPGQNYDIDIIASSPGKMPPIYPHGWNNRYNLEGIITYSEFERKIHAYTQLYRNGIIEAVDGFLLEPNRSGKIISSVNYEKKLIQSLKSYISLLKELNIESPVFLFLTLVGTEGYVMYLPPERYDVGEVHEIDRDILQLPEVIIENYEEKAEYILKPIFDAIWNACGFPRDPYYNENEEWSPR